MELYGKVIDFLGDSITEGVGVCDVAGNRFDHVLRRTCALKAVYNYGISGSRLAHQQVPSENPRFDLCFCGRAFDMHSDADVIVVFGGTNDYGHGDAPFGTMDDRTPATYCGAVHYLMRTLRDLYPHAHVVFMTPARRIGDVAPSADARKGEDRLPLRDYCRVIMDAAPIYGVHVLDLYETLGIDPNQPEDQAAFMPDGLHPNDAGHARIAAVLSDFLRSL